jgi:hypothetical protein
MNKLTLNFVDIPDLARQLQAVILFFGKATDMPAEVNLALFNDEELKTELAERAAIEEAPKSNGGAVVNIDQAPKRKRGRPPKAPPTQAAAAEPTAGEAQAPTNEPAPQAAALPTDAPTEPSRDPAGVAPDMPTEDAMLQLLSDVYSASGDMELVRNCMQEVGGKTQLSMIPVNLWPKLRERLSAERDRFRTAS